MTDEIPTNESSSYTSLAISDAEVVVTGPSSKFDIPTWSPDKVAEWNANTTRSTQGNLYIDPSDSENNI